jgi:hypothetical protein
MTRWMHPSERDREDKRGRFDPVVEGERYRLSREALVAIWERVVAAATDDAGRYDVDQAKHRFHEVAARLASRGGRTRPDVGRVTLVAAETDGDPRGAWIADELAPRIPGRETLVTVDARRWKQRNGEPAAAREDAEAARSTERDDETIGRGEHPGAREVAEALAALLQDAPEPARPLEAPANASMARLFDVDRIAWSWPRGEPDPRSDGRLPTETLERMERAHGQRFPRGGKPDGPGTAVRRPTRGADAAAVYRKANGTPAAADDTAAERLRAAQEASGTSLPTQLRAELAGALGIDPDAMNAISVHVGPAAADAAEAVAAKAFTIGRDIHFAAGTYDPESETGRRLIAHEVVHAVGQPAVTVKPDAIRISDPSDSHERAADELAEAFVARPASRGPTPSPGGVVAASPLGSGATIHRYATGEHVKFGDTGRLIGDAETTYTVKPGEGLDQIAKNTGVSVEVIKERNKLKLKTFVIAGKKIEGFLANEKIQIPTGRKEVQAGPGLGIKATPATPSVPQQTVTIQGITFSYGEVIALGDFYKSPDAILKANKAELLELQKLMQADEKAPGSVTQQQWNDATRRRPPGDQYVEQALDNTDHFAPSDPALAPVSAKNTGKNHKAMWETYHRKALELAQQDKMNDAMLNNGFGDHFLTDAFSAGHLINKDDTMAQFRANVTNPKDAKDKSKRDALCDAVAVEVFKDKTAAAYIARFVTAKTTFEWSIKSADRFATVLKGIDDSEPDKIENSIALAVHDTLNHSNKVEVQNKNGTWMLSGDETLNPTSQQEAQKAVAQSQVNVMNTKGMAGPIDFDGMFKKVWEIVPHPTAKGAAEVKNAVDKGTSPTEPKNVLDVAQQIVKNVELIMKKVVEHGDLKGPK